MDIEQGWEQLDGDARTVLERAGGIASARAFDAAGITRRQLGALLGRGVLDRPRRGWYVDPALPWQVKSAVRVGGVVAGVTAAELWGLPVPPGAQERVHVLVDEHASRFRHHQDRRNVLVRTTDDPRIVFHWSARTPRVIDGRTALVETLVLLTATVSAPWAVAALDAALHVPRGGRSPSSAEQLTLLRSLLPGARRGLLDLIDPRAESCIESLLRLGLRRRGVVDLVLQAQVHPVHRVDFLIGGSLIVEVDGAAFHNSWKDAARDEELVRLGFRVLRFSYERVVFDLETVLDEIQDALAGSR